MWRGVGHRTTECARTTAPRMRGVRDDRGARGAGFSRTCGASLRDAARYLRFVGGRWPGASRETSVPIPPLRSRDPAIVARNHRNRKARPTAAESPVERPGLSRRETSSDTAARGSNLPISVIFCHCGLHVSVELSLAEAGSARRARPRLSGERVFRSAGGPRSAGRPGFCRFRLDAEFGPKRQRSPLGHRFSSEEAPRGVGDDFGENHDLGKRFRWGGKALGALCARRDLCHFDAMSVPNRDRRELTFS